MGAQPDSPLQPSLQPSTPAGGALPPRPSWEQLRKQAKDLLAAVRAGDPAAQQRLARYFTIPTIPASPGGGERRTPAATLVQAQLVIAREHGCSSWTRLRREVQLAPLRAQLARFTQRDWRVRYDVSQRLAQAGPDGMQVVLEGLSDPHPDVRRGAVDFLDHHATDACVPQLAHLAQHDPDPVVRRHAVHALLCERCKETPLQTDVLPLLLQSFRQDPNRQVRFNAALALRPHTDQERVRDAFHQAVRDDPSGLVRRVALNGLRGEERVTLLVQAAQHDPDLRVRVSAASRLGREPGYHLLACQVLEAVLGEEPRLRARLEAHKALRRISPAYRELCAQRARAANLARASEAAASP